MATAKARYEGDGAWAQLPDFSDALKNKLKDYYPSKADEVDSSFVNPQDGFVDVLLSEAWWAKSELYDQQFDSTKQELRAEQADLQKRLQDLEERLLNLSPDFDRVLGVDADPRGCAYALSKLLGHVQGAGSAIGLLPSAETPAVKQAEVMVEMAVRVLRVLKEYGISTAATGDSYFDYTSDAVQILKLIGDDLQVVRGELTWRDTIIKAKRAAPDI